MKLRSLSILLILVTSTGSFQSSAFITQNGIRISSRSAESLRFISLQSKEEDIDDEEDIPLIESTVYVDDGGSDLTDRFKYKVHALMGDFDPVSAEENNENVDGNILNAMMEFPTSYVFNVVGKTKGDEEIAEIYIRTVKDIIISNSGDKDASCEIKARGENFTKIMMETKVESSSMVTNIYSQLADIEETVMRF